MGAMIQNLFSLNFLVPKTAMAISIANAVRGLRGMPRNLLLLGQRGAGGLQNYNTVLEITTEANAIAYLGEGSMALAMWRAAKRNADDGLPIQVLALEDENAGQQAAGKLAVTVTGGNTPQAGTISLFIGGVSIRVGVKLDEDANAIAARIVAEINALTALPLTAAVNGTNANEVDLTCRWKGSTGNHIDVRVNYYDDDRLPTDVAIAVTAMSGGATDPDLSAAITAMAGKRFTEVVSPYTDSTSLVLLEGELERRWAFDDMKDGQLITAQRGTEGTVTAWAANRNSPSAHTIATRKDLTNPWETASMVGAAIESSSAIDPATPYFGRELDGYMPARSEDDWEEDQLNVLLANGVSYLHPLIGGGAMLGRMVTNYTLNELGAPDMSLRNLNWVKLLSYWRWFRVTDIQLNYLAKGFKLGEYVTEPIPGQKIMTAELAEEIALEAYEEFINSGLMQNMAHYQKTLLTQIDGANGKMKQVEQPVLMTQFYQAEITSEFKVSV